VPLDQTNLINHIRLNANNFDLSKIKEEVVFLKSVGVDFIVGLFHYGLAYQFFPAPHIKENTYRIFEETGIDLIIGNHAHNIQPVEKYKYYCLLERREKCSLVAYALGDFIGDDIFDWCTMSMYLKINIVKYKTKDSVETRIKIIEPKIIIRTEDKSSGKLKLCFAEDVFMHGPKKYNFKNLHIQNYNSNKSLYTRFKNRYTTHQ
jgi:poly-gamma-glutamate synthesis protein (capsule biosynthesis protein)